MRTGKYSFTKKALRTVLEIVSRLRTWVAPRDYA